MSDNNIFGESGSIEDGGGYDLTEIKKAMQANEAKTGDEKGFEDVDPIYVDVDPDAIVVRTEEYEARVVILEYDSNDNIVGVELL